MVARGRPHSKGRCDVPAAALNVIDAAELKRRLDRGLRFEFWNVLTDDYFTHELIPGSRRVPLDQVGRAAAPLAKDAPILVYCSGPSCPQSRLAGEKLATLGFSRVDVFEGGLEQWKTAGHAVVASA